MPTPEAQAREKIDEQLVAAGWLIQNYKGLNLGAGRGIALREVPLKTGPCDYLLLVDRRPVGVIEAKKFGTTLSGVAEQSTNYADNLPEFLAKLLPDGITSLPFLYESTGVETLFRDERDPEPRSRRVFKFHRPETFADWLSEPDTLRARLAAMPTAHPLPAQNLRACQVEGITHLEESFTEAQPRALIQMATGAGKTYTACAFTYRLIKHGGAKRVLFLVDRANLGRQAMAEFQQFVAPDTGRKFTEVYNVQHLISNQLDSVARVTICTIQRLYSLLRGEELDEDLDEKSGYEIATADDRPKDVAYNPAIPIEAFDFIVTDECHRSIYGLWRQVLEYFDAFLIGLTATPSKQTIGFFNQNLVMEYNHERAVADGVNVGYEVYRIKTQVTEQGGRVEKGFYVDRRSKETRAVRWERLDEDLAYASSDLDRSVVVSSQIRTVLQAFKDALFTELFPGRTLVPKTLIFCKDDSHAEDTVHLVREVFGKGNDFAKKITYKTYNPETKRYEKSETLIQEFRTSPSLRIAVTVDMIATGTDIKPLECLLFLRDTRSALSPFAITENELPKGWRWARVNEIGQVKLGRQRAPKHQNGANMRPYLRVANVFEDRLDLSDVLTMNFTPAEFETFALRENDILLNEGQSLHLVGRPALYRNEVPGVCFQNTLVRFRAGLAVEPKFALTICRGYMHTGKFQKIARWTTNIAHLGAQRFAEMPFPLPPLPEQRRIVAEIEKQFTRLDAGIAALRRTQANLKRYRAAVLKAACEGHLLSPPDSNWPVTTVGELAQIVTKGSSPNWQGFEYCDTGILFVRSQNVGWGRLDLLDVARLPAGFSEKEKKSILKTGDVLLNIVGASIGRAAVATIEIAGGNVNQAVAVIRPITSMVSAKYLVCYLLSDKAQALIHSQKVDVARANLSLEQIRNLSIPLPPLAEQTRIVAEVERRLSVVEELEAVVSANLQRATRLRQSILQQAFAGSL